MVTATGYLHLVEAVEKALSLHLPPGDKDSVDQGYPNPKKMEKCIYNYSSNLSFMRNDMNIIGDQVEIARSSESRDPLEFVLKKKNDPLSKRIREFHRNFLDISSIEDDWWHNIFVNPHGEHISYYRKDSCLLSDYAFILKPTTALITPVINPNYYGVGPAGIKLLAENDMVWLMALHPNKYEKSIAEDSGLSIINSLSKKDKTPYYIDTFEDALASYWIRNIKDDSLISDSAINRNLDNYLTDPENVSFSDFLNDYYKYIIKSNQIKNIDLIEQIPEGRVELNAGLFYNDLRADARERLLKIQLFQECLNEISGERKLLIDLDQTLLEIKDILASDHRSLFLDTSRYEKGRKMELIGYFIFQLWQQKGAFWSYAEGNTVDFSGRDLSQNGDCLRNLSESRLPNQKLTEIRIPIPGKLRKLIEGTNIDDRDSITTLSEKRFYYLQKYLNDLKKANFDLQENLKRIDEITRITDDDKLREKINSLPQWSPREWELGAGLISLGSFAISNYLDLDPELSIAMGLGLDVTCQVINHRSTLKRIMKYGMDTYTGIGHYYKIENALNSLDLISNASSYNIQAIHLPYRRNDQQFSGKELTTFGSGGIS
jgi:hypothetical protein